MVPHFYETCQHREMSLRSVEYTDMENISVGLIFNVSIRLRGMINYKNLNF